MAGVTDEILSGIEYRAGMETIRQKMYGLDNPSRLETATPGRNRRRVVSLGTAAYLIMAVACRGSPAAPTGPTNPNTATLQVYNATTGQRKEMTVEVPSGSNQVTINAENLASGLDNVVTNEFAVRRNGESNSLGLLVMAAGPQASVSPGNYAVFVPASGGRYECAPNAALIKRNIVIGIKNKQGIDSNVMPWYFWTDGIDELNRKGQSDTGTRYVSLVFDANAANPDLTVGFSNEPDPSLPGASAWAEGFKNAYVLTPKNSTGWVPNYNSPVTKDKAWAELFEMMLRRNDICGEPSSITFGNAAVTKGKDWGLNAIGVNFFRRAATRTP